MRFNFDSASGGKCAHQLVVPEWVVPVSQEAQSSKHLQERACHGQAVGSRSAVSTPGR